MLLALLPLCLALFTAVSAIPADTNASRLRRGLPLKAPATRVRRQTSTTSQGVISPGTNGVMAIQQRPPSRRSLEERAAPQSGYIGYDGTAFKYTTSAASAAVFNFPTDAGTDQPLRINTPNGLAYVSFTFAYGFYAMITTPTWDGTTTFTWSALSGSTFSNLNAKAGGSGIYFRLDSNNDKLVPISTFSATANNNPIWIYPGKAPVAIGGPAALQAEIDKMVKATNDYRAEYGALPLTYNPTIAAFSQTVADKCEFKHSDGNGGLYGENLAYGGVGYDSIGAIDGWGTREAPLYDYNTPVFSSAAGHFTALVWKATTQFGCAWKLCAPNTLNTKGNQPTEAMYIVCNYQTPGNVEGQFVQNVGRHI